MVPERWYAILESKRLGKKPLGVKRLGESLVLWRNAAGEVVCMPDRCSHRGSVLSEGRVENSCLECPWHGFQFDDTGSCRLIPANGKGKPVPRAFGLRTYVTREEHGFIWLWWGRRREALPELPWFAEVPATTANSHTTILEWPVSFERVMESMLDMHHFPFLHRKVKPRPGALMDPYHAEMEGDVIHTWGNLRHDDGKSAEESPGIFFRMSVHFPAVLFMEMTPKLHLLGVCAPMDKDSTWIALRYYQSYLRAPAIGNLLAWLSAYIELKFVHPDDERMLRTAEPWHPTAGSYRLIPADKGVALWLKHWERQSRPGHAPLEEAAAEAPAPLPAAEALAFEETQPSR